MDFAVLEDFGNDWVSVDEFAEFGFFGGDFSAGGFLMPLVGRPSSSKRSSESCLGERVFTSLPASS